MATEAQEQNPQERLTNTGSGKLNLSEAKTTTAQEVKGVLEQQALSEEIATVWAMTQAQIPALQGVPATIQKRAVSVGAGPSSL